MQGAAVSRHRGLDPRLNPYRSDMAAAHLRGEVEASRFVEGVDHQVKAAATPLRGRPDEEASALTHLLHGEVFRVYEEKNGWSWGQAASDDYVGYVDSATLSKRVTAPTHRVAALRTFVYPAPNLKTPPLTALSMGAKLTLVGASGNFSEVEDGGYVFTAHLCPDDAHVKDFVSVAEQFVGVPYLWGGRDALGIDCSALVQISLEQAGIAALRDSDLQEAVLGERLPEPLDFSNLKRGDLVFWRGHVAIMVDAERMVHCNATHMRCVIEPLETAAARIARTEGPITSIKRLKMR